jgi:hypothetical protein
VYALFLIFPWKCYCTRNISLGFSVFFYHSFYLFLTHHPHFSLASVESQYVNCFITSYLIELLLHLISGLPRALHWVLYCWTESCWSCYWSHMQKQNHCICVNICNILHSGLWPGWSSYFCIRTFKMHACMCL